MRRKIFFNIKKKREKHIRQLPAARQTVLSPVLTQLCNLRAASVGKRKSEDRSNRWRRHKHKKTSRILWTSRNNWGGRTSDIPRLKKAATQLIVLNPISCSKTISNRRKQRSPAEEPSHKDWQSWTKRKWHISEKSIKCRRGLCGDWNCTIFKKTSTAGGKIDRDKWCRVSPKHSNHLNPPTVPDDSLNRGHKHQFYKSKHFQLYRQLQDDITLKCSTVK